MTPIFAIIWFFFNAIVNAIGVVANVFIVAVNLLDWAKGRSLNTCDRILVALGLSGACFQSAVIAYIHVPVALGKNLIRSVLHHLLSWSGYSSNWLTTCLCVFYCIKIVDFNHRLFIWLKLRISKIVHWMLLGSVVGSMVLTIPVSWDTYEDSSQNSTTNHTAHITIIGAAQKWIWLYQIICQTLGFHLPLVFDIVSIALILLSLQIHTKRMKENPSGFSQPRLEAHFGAAKVLASLLVMYIILALAELRKRILPPIDILDLIGCLVLAFPLPIQSIILILGNIKLRKYLWKVLLPWRK